MATKTITIDLEAYNALRRRKREGQSFSDVIKEHFQGGMRGHELRSHLKGLALEEESLDAIDRVIEARRSDPARAPDL